MGQKDEFSKWIATVESALSGKTQVDEELLEQDSCGCGHWDCPTCFPDTDGSLDSGQPGNGIIIVTGGDEECMEPPCNDEEPQGIGMAGTHPVGADTYSDDEDDNLDFVELGIEEDDVEECDDAMPEVSDKPIFGGPGKHLGKIIQKYVPAGDTGSESPLTHGDELEEDDSEMPPNSHEDTSTIIDQILNMQTMGLSNGDTVYTAQDLSGLPSDKLLSIQQQVIGNSTNNTGEVDEATLAMPDEEDDERPKPTDDYDPMNFDFGMDIGGMSNDQPLSHYKEPSKDKPNQGSKQGIPGMRTASADDTRRAAGAIRPDDEMMSWMRRINPAAGGNEPELEPQPPEQEMVVRQARDVPQVISNAMQATGFQSPAWHKISNLPGYRQQNIRGMGRGIFGMFTSTPLEDIKTIANVQGQGPNTDAEMRAVASWLMNNAEDMGDVNLDHGEAIPGYRPDVKEYRVDGVRFHVVRDPMGQYIYAYPDADARINTGRARLGQQQNQEEEPRMLGRNTPRLRESASFSLMEELEWDERIRETVRDLLESEIDEAKTAQEYRKQQSDKKKAAMAARKGVNLDEPKGNYPVTRVIGRKPGGKKLIDVLHGMQKLSNEAKLQPISVRTGKDAAQLAWAQFNNNPDDFVVVSGENGVAGIKPDKASVEKFKATAAKKGKQPNFSKHAGAIRYEVIAFSDNGARIPERMLQPADAAPDNGGDLDDYQDMDQGPKVKAIKARMGLVHGQDTQNPDNVFNLLNTAIGPLRTVWIAGWAGERGNGNDTETLPQSPGAVERGKMAHRAATPAAPELRHDRAFKAANPELSPRGVKKPTPTGTAYDPEEEANRPSWYKPKFNETAMGDADRKSARDKMRYAGQPTRKAEPEVYREPTINMLFTRLNPVFKRVIDKVAGRTDLRWTRAVEARNHREAAALGQKAEALANIKNQLESTGVPVLTQQVKSAFVKGLVNLSGANSEYDKEFMQYLGSITQPMATIHGKTVPGNVANSAKLQDVAKAFERALLAL